jgi:hypothetical protein
LSDFILRLLQFQLSFVFNQFVAVKVTFRHGLSDVIFLHLLDFFGIFCAEWDLNNLLLFLTEIKWYRLFYIITFLKTLPFSILPAIAV